MKHIDSDGIVLTGLDGSNPLAFLAALGTLRTLSLSYPKFVIRMCWQMQSGAWRPKVCCHPVVSQEDIVNQLHIRLQSMKNHPAFAIGDNLNLPASAFHKYAKASQDILTSDPHTDRTYADFIAAFGSDVCFSNDDPDPIIADTALRTMSGAGHQHFLKFFRELVLQTQVEHLDRALFHPWDYGDEGRGLNLRWDPADDRRYALRWGDPSGDPVKSMRGANRLAMEALPVLPTMPTERGLATTAFEDSGRRNTFFNYPIWSTAITLDVVKSIVGMRAELKRLDRTRRSALGVVEMFQSQRITTGKFRNFTPARSI